MITILYDYSNDGDDGDDDDDNDDADDSNDDNDDDDCTFIFSEKILRKLQWTRSYKFTL